MNRQSGVVVPLFSLTSTQGWGIGEFADLPHFARCIAAGVGSVMSAYNRVNGTWCAEHEHLLREILKGEWGFDGFVESDWLLGMHDTAGSIRAGLDRLNEG